MRQNKSMDPESVAIPLDRDQDEEYAQERIEARELERRFEELYENNAGMVYNLCYRMLSNRADAQDAAQEAFCKVYKNLGKFKGRSKLSTWVYRITMNHCIDVIRRRKPPALELAEWVASPSRDNDLRMALEKAVTSLAPSYRGVFVLHDIQGFRHAEIAQILAITPGSSKSLLHRSRVILRKRLKGIRRRDGSSPV